MPNILEICWEPEKLKLSLINVKRKSTPLREGYLIEEVASEALGRKTLECLAGDGLESVDKLQYSSVERKLIRLVNRLRNNAVTFPIDEVRVNEVILSCPWIYDQLSKILKMELHKINTVCQDTEAEDLDNIKEAHELVLIYKEDEILLLNEHQMISKSKKEDVIFELSFSLDTAMKFIVTERWKDNGITKYKEVRKAIFYHPIFYTGDKMKIHIYQNNDKWQFKLTHIATGEEMSF